MKRILIVGAGKCAATLLPIISSSAGIEIIAVIDQNKFAKGFELAKKMKITTCTDWKKWLNKEVDIILELTGDQNVLDEIIALCNNKTEVIPHSIASIISDIITEDRQIQTLTKELKQAKKKIQNFEEKHNFDDIIGSSQEMQLALEQAKIAANTPLPILLRGDAGTGKELFARAIHNESNRQSQKYKRVNCTRVDEMMLFGCEQDTDAKQPKKKGLLEEANHGSIFLDEIANLSQNIQEKLLHLIKKGEIIRVGGARPLQIDVRIIAATTVNLEKAMISRKFNQELYYQLNRFPIYIPALHERIADLSSLTQHFIEKLNIKFGKNIRSISDDAIQFLAAYHWPGNLHELENVLGRAMIYVDSDENIISKEHFLEFDTSPGKNNKYSVVFSYNEPLHTVIERFEKDYIYEVYKRNAFNKTKTAKNLNISIRNLYYKMEKYQLE